MSLFGNRTGSAPSPEPTDPLPIETFDVSKRYDIYCSIPGEDRLYEDVKIVGIRAFEKPKNEFRVAIIGGYLEIEAANGARMMIQHHRINMICEHGSTPVFKVLRVRNSAPDY